MSDYSDEESYGRITKLWTETLLLQKSLQEIDSQITKYEEKVREEENISKNISEFSCWYSLCYNPISSNSFTFIINAISHMFVKFISRNFIKFLFSTEFSIELFASWNTVQMFSSDTLMIQKY